MSLWVCPTHGLYGGQVFCPHCGGGGSYATFGPIAASGTEAGTVETEGLDPKDDGQVAKPDAHD